MVNVGPGSVPFACANNLVASVSIILVNKQIFSVCKFNFIITLLFLNFVTTYTALSVATWLGWMKVKHMPARDRWLISFLGVLTVFFNNASAEANSVGLYQILKLLIVPTVIMLERLRGEYKYYSKSIVTAIFVTSVGVAIATVSDVQLNARGCALSFLSNLVTAQYQLWQNSKQKEHNLSAMQITHTVGMPQSVLGITGSLLLDVCCPWIKKFLLLHDNALLTHVLGPYDLYWIAGCCLLAVYMNVATYAVLGKISPVSYQILGQVKTVLIVAMGYTFFDKYAPPLWLCVRFSGVLIAVGGAFTYGKLKNAEQAPPKKDK